MFACIHVQKKSSSQVPNRVGESSIANLTPPAPPEDAPQLPRDISTPVSLCSDSSSTTANSPLIPDHWRPEVEYCIGEKMLSDSARNDIIRTLVSQLFARIGKKPSRAECEDCSRKLILKYPMFKDDMGNGYVSTVDPCMYYYRNQGDLPLLETRRLWVVVFYTYRKGMDFQGWF